VTKPHPVEPPAHGFRRLVTVAKIGESGLQQTIEAKPPELEKIAAHLELVAVQKLTADVAFARWRGKGIRLNGKLKADVTQACVVTLDPVEAHVEVEFERRFLPEETLGREQPEAHEVFVDPDGEDPAEPLGREIDVGEILVEELSLNLDPYPRKAGVEFKGEEGDAPDRRENPFAKLAKLKPKLVDKDR
jgi:uncharacterized metal-binding protein YceD (DUF177 family)